MPDRALNIDDVLHRILKPDGNALFFVFSNADNKCWIIPGKQTKTALNLYQPSSLKGKWMKRLFPLLKNSRLFRSKLGIEVKSYALCDELEALLQRLFQKDNLEFSLFCGTPSVHQKITIQISAGKKILGYCKVSDNEEIKAIFKHEQQVLDELGQKEVKQIPKCIYRGILSANMDLFVQTTTKTNASKVIHSMTKHHWDFLAQVSIQTKQQLPFGDTDFSQMLERLSFQLKHLPERDAALVISALTGVKKHFDNNTVSFSGYHADFTPWNMFVEKNELFVFDFEYAQLTYPPYLDYFHFFTQQAIYTNHWNADEIFEAYIKQKSQLVNYFPNPDFSYLCYLLDIMERYINREKGALKKDTQNNMKVWVSLVSNVMRLQKI